MSGSVLVEVLLTVAPFESSRIYSSESSTIQEPVSLPRGPMFWYRTFHQPSDKASDS